MKREIKSLLRVLNCCVLVANVQLNNLAVKVNKEVTNPDKHK